jgi:hypothetical protein
LIKTSIITAPHSLPLTFGFWRKTDSAASAITGMTFRLFPAAFTKRLESYGRPCDNPTVLYLMAILAKRDAVRWLISQSRIIAPFLDVVGVYRSRCAALLTGKIVTLKNSGTPLFIFIAAMLFRIRNLRCFVSTGRAAMLRFWMPSPLLKLSSTVGAYPNRGCMNDLITLFRAVDIWRIGYFGNKISSTNRASFSPAGVTAQTGWLATCERLTTLVAYIHGLIISFMQRMSTPFCILQRMTDAFPGIEIKRIKKA